MIIGLLKTEDVRTDNPQLLLIKQYYNSQFKDIGYSIAKLF